MSDESHFGGVEHWGDCSMYKANPKTGECCYICDCGALRKAALTSERSDVWNKAWARHLAALDRSMAKFPPECDFCRQEALVLEEGDMWGCLNCYERWKNSPQGLGY